MKIVIVAELSPLQIQEIANEVIKLTKTNTETTEINTDFIELMSVKEASKISGVNEQTIRRHIESKLLPAKKVGKSFKINRQDFNKYING